MLVLHCRGDDVQVKSVNDYAWCFRLRKARLLRRSQERFVSMSPKIL